MSSAVRSPVASEPAVASPSPSPSSVVSAPSPSAASDAPMVRKAIIPIAGQGSRMFPASRACVLALMPLVDVDGLAKPILQIIIEEVLQAMGWEETATESAAEIAPDAAPSSPSASAEISVALVVQPGPQRQQVQDYFSAESADAMLLLSPEQAKQARRRANIGKLLHFVVQEKQTGVGGAVLLCRSWAGSDPFLLLLGDHVYLSAHPDRSINCARQLLDLHACVGRNASGAMCTALSDCSEEDLPDVAVVQGSLVQGLDLYAAHTALQAEIRATHLRHGLDLARLELEVDGISRFKKQSLPAAAPTPQLQGDIMRLTRVAERPSSDHASDHFTVAHSKMEFVCCMGIDLLGPRIFEALQKQMDQIEAEAAATTAAATAATAAAPKVDDKTEQTQAASAVASSNAALTAPMASSSSSSSSSAPSSPPRDLCLRSALDSLLSDSSSPAVFGLHVLGSRHDTGRPLSYAHTMHALAEEARARRELAQELAEMQHDKATQAAAAPTAAASSPQATAAGGASPVVPLSNAALRQRAAYD